MEPVNPDPFDDETAKEENGETKSPDTPEEEGEQTGETKSETEHTGYPHPDDVPGVGPGSYPAENGKE